MTTPLTAPTDRRRFLGRMGMTLAAGLGLAAVGSIGGSAEAAPKAEGGGDSVKACAIYCSRTAEPCNSCGTGIHRYRCSGPCGTYYACYQHACSSYCLSQSAC
jgi:hypothetical protein